MPPIYSGKYRLLYIYTNEKIDFVCFLQYDCIAAPLRFENVDYAWWMGRNSSKMHSFWTGKDLNVNNQYQTPGVIAADAAYNYHVTQSNFHRCQCADYGNCIDYREVCNCDAMAPTLQTDKGI